MTTTAARATDHATAADFTRWQQQARSMTSDALRWAHADCRAAAEAMSGHNPAREGYYRDQAATFWDELRSRKEA